MVQTHADGLNVESIPGDDVFRGQSLSGEVDSEHDAMRL